MSANSGEKQRSTASEHMRLHMMARSGVRTEMGNALIEEDGRTTTWQQFPAGTPAAVH